MRIGIEAQRIYRPNKHGMDVVALETARHLVQVAAEHTIVVFVRPDDDPCLEPAPNLEVREIEGWSYPTWEQWTLPHAVRDAEVDLLYCSSNTAPLNPGVPLVIWLHDVIYLEGQSPLFASNATWYQRLGNTYRQWVVPRVFRTADAIITSSDYEKEQIERVFPGETDHVQRIYYGIAERFRPVTDDATHRRVRERYDLPDEYILFLGNTAPKKNTPTVLRAYVEYHDAADDPLPLVVADYDRSHVRAHLRDFGRRDLLDAFQTPGYIAHEDMAAVYSLASLFLYPSLRESFGMPSLEAMACGTPVITSTISSMPEINGDAALKVDPRDPSAIADATQRVLGHPDLQDDLRERGLKRSAQFSWTNTAEHLLETFERLVSLDE
jgi:glycosyltransferase involved in cell wall biosynthesis